MARAFKCDSCLTLNEGQPCRYKLHKYHNANSFGWADREAKGKAELCEECAEELENAVDEYL